MGFYRSPRNDLNMVRGAACIAQTPERLIIVISVMDKGTKARVGEATPRSDPTPRVSIPATIGSVLGGS